MAAMAAQFPITGIMPSLTTLIQAPRPATVRIHIGARTARDAQTKEPDTSAAPGWARDTTLPQFVTSESLLALRRSSSASSAAMTAQSVESILRTIPRSVLRRSSSALRPYPVFSPISRAFSTTTCLGPFTIRAPTRVSVVGFTQQRTIFGKTWGATSNRNMLAQLEQTANNNAGSASAQNAFYQALIRANMPDIVVERHNTGRYASNASVEAAYEKALERVGTTEAQSHGIATSKMQGQNRELSEQLQAIGQAVSARNRGANVSISKTASGAKSEPLYVVVDETLRSVVFRWMKFLVTTGAVVYFLIIIFNLVVDTIGVSRRPGGIQHAEAKPELQTTRFTDVHGCDEAKEELQELVEFLKAPDKFNTLGGKLPKGVLLVGPPGTGKTLLARAVAGEAGVPFFYMSGSEFDEVYVGVGAKRVRELFNNARNKQPSIIFIDELDAIGSKRHERDAAYAKQTLNQLLTELDGFDQNSKVIIIGATNFPQSLDKALTRPGRFDRNIVVPLPDVRGRIAILKHHLRNIRVATDVDPAIIARGCPGFSGAELENVVNQAAIRASKLKASKVGLEDMMWAKDKILMGAERRSAVIQQKDKVMTAYHEGGHALVAMLTEASTPLYKATIMPRGHALGLTQMLPEMDKVSETKKEMMAQIDVCMGGKVAEELVYGPDNVTTGASSDIQNATRIAYMMVTQAGMSDAIGNIDLSSDYGRLSSETKKQIENEVRRLVEEGRERALALLTRNREGLDRLAHALVEYETLGKEEMEKVVRGEKLPDKLKSDSSTPIKVAETLIPGPFGLPPLPPSATGVTGPPEPRGGDDATGGPRPYPAGPA